MSFFDIMMLHIPDPLFHTLAPFPNNLKGIIK